MARPKSFDTNQVLDAAIDCFWRDGMKSASTRDLAARMGIAGPSLYNAFGCKRELFARALDRYAECVMRAGFASIEDRHTPAEAIAAFFRRAIDKALKDLPPANCLILNTAMEIDTDDGPLCGQMAGYLSEIGAFLERNLDMARQRREIPPNVEPEDTAQMLLSVLLGICVLARSRPERAFLERVVCTALTPLGIDLKYDEKKGMT